MLLGVSSLKGKEVRRTVSDLAIRLLLRTLWGHVRNGWRRCLVFGVILVSAALPEEEKEERKKPLLLRAALEAATSGLPCS